MNGPWEVGETFAATGNPHGFSTLLFQNRVPEVCKLEMDLTFSETVREIGVALQVNREFGTGYYLSYQPHRARLEWKSGLRMYDEGGWTFPFDVEMERPIALEPNMPHKLKVFIQGSIVVAYLDGQVALNTRMYDYSHQLFGLFASNGTARFDNIRLWT